MIIGLCCTSSTELKHRSTPNGTGEKLKSGGEAGAEAEPDEEALFLREAVQ